MSAVSRLVLAGFDGTTLSEITRRRLVRLRPGGVVLFRRNIGDPKEVQRLTNDLRFALGSRTLIAVDQEGGRVMRLRSPFTEWPAMLRVGATRSPALVRRLARAMGRELAVAGFNCDFAPVLDVHSNPGNPVIGDRAFGGDAAWVTRLALAFAAGLSKAGIVPCGKHFPGHGDTDVDSHLALPIVPRDRGSLGRIELAPFAAAIRARIPMLMTAHVLYPSLDAASPATLSRRIAHELLRTEMGFRGVLVSDDLAMHALDRFGSVEEVARRALEAGCDWLLCCQSLDDAERVAESLTRRWRCGRLRHAAVALRRTRALRRRLPARRVTIDDLRSVLGSDEPRRIVDEIERLQPTSRALPGVGSQTTAADQRD